MTDLVYCFVNFIDASVHRLNSLDTGNLKESKDRVSYTSLTKTLKKFQSVRRNWSKYSRMDQVLTSNLLKAVFHKFYLVYSRIL